MSQVSPVKKHCSILNYLRNTNYTLYLIIQDLCIGRLFVPRRGTTGITFLLPDNALIKKLTDLSKNEPEEAVNVFKSLILQGYFPNTEAFTQNKDNIPNMHGNKVDVTSSTTKGTVLSGSCKLSPDKEFLTREDRKNMMIYEISGDFPDKGTVKADPAKVAKVEKKKTVKGGKEEESTVFGLFNNILKIAALSKSTVDDVRESAANCLVAIYKKLKANDVDEKHLDMIAASFSYDTLVSLYLVLDLLVELGLDIPYATIKSSIAGNPKKTAEMFEEYQTIRKSYSASCTCKHTKSQDTSRPQAVEMIKKTYKEGCPLHTICKGDENLNKLMCYAEARAISANIQSNEAYNLKSWIKDYTNVMSVYTLTNPVNLLGKTTQDKNMSIVMYYSVIIPIFDAKLMCYNAKDDQPDSKTCDIASQEYKPTGSRNEGATSMFGTFSELLNKQSD